MKFTGISMAVVMLLAIVLRSLPDSVFNYFHHHTHVSYTDLSADEGSTVKNFQHNCHIGDWNFESFEVNENCFETVQNIHIQPVFSSQTDLSVSLLVSQIGRGPPTV
jgi:hypothetical protein